MLAAMPTSSRRWLKRFVDGINNYQEQMRDAPTEYRILAIQPEPWSPEDVLTFGRLAGTDVNWLVWFNLLRLRARPDWPQIWARLVGTGGGAPPGPTANEDMAGLGALLSQVSRSGSNSLAIAPSRTSTGAAIIASDPHLGLSLPNTWLIIGLKSPSYHVVGLMVPGLPVFAIGRNPWIAWGGTNMRASASDLIDVSGLPPIDPGAGKRLLCDGGRTGGLPSGKRIGVQFSQMRRRCETSGSAQSPCAGPGTAPATR